MNEKNNGWTFMFVAYLFSWLFWILDALIAPGIWNAPEALKNYLASPYNLGPWAPLFAAIVVTFIYQGGSGVKNLLRRGIVIRLGKWWWVILLTFPVLIGGSLALSSFLGNPTPDFEALAQPFVLPIGLVIIFFNRGLLQEEFGWRGYVFEKLRSKFNALNAVIISGLMWGLLLTTTLVGIILAWFYVNTRGSIFATMLGHAMFIQSNWVFPALKTDSALILFGLYFIAVLLIIWRYGRKKLSRA